MKSKSVRNVKKLSKNTPYKPKSKKQVYITPDRVWEKIKEFWGYDKSEQFNNEELIKEKYRGIRPAPGYPACPDHTEKNGLFALLNARQNAGIELTDSMAMMPASSVSGYYLGHPDSQYFGIGKISKDQVQDYANRKDMELSLMERWLAPNLAYSRS